MIFTYNGCDARQKYKTMERAAIASCYEKECYNGLCNSGTRDLIREKRIRIISKYADHIFAVNPDLLYFLPRNLSTFLPYTISSWYKIEAIPYKIDRRIRVVHSPTDRAAKGSRYIIQTLERLAKRFPIDLSLIENMTNQKALEAYREADLIIDQILIGWYGGFAVEAMKMGKPVCVFIREDDLKFIPKNMEKDLLESVININPLNIERVLEEYFQNPHLLYEKGKAGLEYVHRWHDPVYVAGLTKAVYEN